LSDVGTTSDFFLVAVIAMSDYCCRNICPLISLESESNWCEAYEDKLFHALTLSIVFPAVGFYLCRSFS